MTTPLAQQAVEVLCRIDLTLIKWHQGHRDSKSPNFPKAEALEFVEAALTDLEAIYLESYNSAASSDRATVGLALRTALLTLLAFANWRFGGVGKFQKISERITEDLRKLAGLESIEG